MTEHNYNKSDQRRYDFLMEIRHDLLTDIEMLKMDIRPSNSPKYMADKTLLDKLTGRVKILNELKAGRSLLSPQEIMNILLR